MVPYYIIDGREIIVPVSDVVNGRLVFFAPASATYSAKQNQNGFTDIQNHWARESIDFTAARGLFVGDGNQLFDPNGQMTRAMFATVLAKLDGVDLTQYANSGFTDVPAGSYYARSVAWAAIPILYISADISFPVLKRQSQHRLIP